MRILACLALVACDAAAAPPPTPAPRARAGSGQPPLAEKIVPPPNDVPQGWVRVTPDAARFECAKSSDTTWRVTQDDSQTIGIACNTVVIAKATDHNAYPGWAPPQLQLPARREYRGARHVFALDDDVLVGFDAGEQGGGLYWFSRDGKQSKQLGDKNVRGFEADGGHDAWGVVLAFEGRDHADHPDGDVRIMTTYPGRDRTDPGAPIDSPPHTALLRNDSTVVPLAAAPEAFSGVCGGFGDVVVVTAKDLEDYFSGSVTSLQPLALPPGLDADSMVVTGLNFQSRSFASHNVWIGMRHFVLRLVPSSTPGKVFDEEWYVPESCKTAHLESLSSGKRCVCGA